jgi:cytidine deaminase
MKLDQETQSRLLKEARSAQRRAYAPYSNFRVGAAILTDKGQIVTGCNVENASYGLTICAERNAIGQCVIMEAGKPLACVVVGPTAGPLAPCGACRQVLLEFNPQMQIICVGADGTSAEFLAKDLLPHAFSESDLGDASHEIRTDDRR